MKPRQYGPCGLYCGACGATDCNGCLSDFTDGSVRQCRFRKCAQDRGIAACSFCADYPCPPLDEFMSDKWPHHWTMKPNHEFIKLRGVEAWLDAQEKNWICPDCGEPTFWYQKACECGRTLEAWSLPE